MGRYGAEGGEKGGALRSSDPPNIAAPVSANSAERQPPSGKRYQQLAQRVARSVLTKLGWQESNPT